MMTNGEHDDLWRKGAHSIQYLKDINDNLRRANAIECMKNLRDIDAIDDEQYKRFMVGIIKDCGFIISYESNSKD